MSLESLIDFALHQGAGVTLADVMQSASYRRRLATSLNLPSRYGPKTDKGCALRSGPMFFGGTVNVDGEAVALALTRGSDSSVSTAMLTESTQIHELGRRLIQTAVEHLSFEQKEIAREFRIAKTAEQQMSLLDELALKIRRASQARLQRSPNADCDATASVPLGYEWVASYFEEHQLRRFLPTQFGSLKENEGPNCLGMLVLLAAWAKVARAQFLCTTEIVNASSEGRRFSEAACSMTLAALQGVGGNRAASLRKSLRRDLLILKRRKAHTLDWHHAIAVELLDRSWFYVDPYGNIAHEFPECWAIGDVAGQLRKYRMVLPGLSLIAHDHGTQRRGLNASLDQLTETLAKAQSAKYKLAPGFGDSMTIDELLESAPELEYLCELVVKNSLGKTDPDAQIRARLAFLLIGWDHDKGISLKLPREEIAKRLERLGSDPRFRHQKLCELVMLFCQEGLIQSGCSGSHIHPVLELGNPAVTVGLAVLSNLLSWTGHTAPATLLLDHGNSQTLWHEALSPIPSSSSLTHCQRELLRIGAQTIADTHQHKRVALKLQALRDFPDLLRVQED